MRKIEVILGDITKIKVDAIVNAANSELNGGGGVDGAIHRAGGPQILEECMEIRAQQGACKTGEAVITSGGKLPAKFVIHTVGPIWSGREVSKQIAQLASCYTESLRLALDHKIKTIAFPNISTGVYDFPKDIAAETAITTVQDFLAKNNAIARVIFVCFDDENFHLYQNAIN
jgi:O-acetyl-ADP-ribose deacetylase